ncbi:hypothetical protein R3P38DRAFT_3173469 [Favolaschia claudopus]|uniref:Zn(2)-C6 fungal-type domain-containing protein n=1 Tax=Favolaschia claudopus TaxID=2862362 RepID=A0AAW0DFF5_9AGAR
MDLRLLFLQGRPLFHPLGTRNPVHRARGNASAEDPFVDPTPASASTAALVMAAAYIINSDQHLARVLQGLHRPFNRFPGGGSEVEEAALILTLTNLPLPQQLRLGRSSSRSRGRGSRGTSVATRRSTRTKIKPDNTLEAVATGLDPDESSAETKPARLSKRRRAELEEADDEESSSDDEGEPEVSPPPKRRKVSEKASAKGKGRAKSEESDDGYVSQVPKLVKKTRGVSQKNKEAPYVPNFDPVIFDQEFAAVALSKLETDFRTLFKDGNNVLQLAGCGNCILRNRKCHRSKFNKDCRACKRGKLSHCSHKFTQMDVIRMIEGFAPITAFSNAGWNR